MDIDVTLLMQLGLITLFIVVLRPLLVMPLMEVMDSRHLQTHGARSEVRRMERLTAIDKEAYQSKLARAKHEVHMRREQQRQSGRDKARAIEDAARQEATQTLLVHRAALREAEKTALAELSGQTPARARILVAKMLGREVQS